MLKIYHHDSLRRAQNRRLGIAFGIGLLAGLVLTFNGSRALVEVAHADNASHAATTASERHLPLDLKLSTRIAPQPAR